MLLAVAERVLRIASYVQCCVCICVCQPRYLPGPPLLGFASQRPRSHRTQVDSIITLAPALCAYTSRRSAGVMSETRAAMLLAFSFGWNVPLPFMNYYVCQTQSPTGPSHVCAAFGPPPSIAAPTLPHNSRTIAHATTCPSSFTLACPPSTFLPSCPLHTY